MATAAHAEAVIGREVELHAIGDFLEQASQQAAGLILEGEAGIGKTTLWKEGVRAASARGARVLSCRPGGHETQLSFAGLDDLLSEVAAETLSELPSPQRHALEVALLLKDAGGEPPDHRTIAVAFLGVLRRIAAAGPALVAVDDVQWLDGPSKVVLEFAARRLRGEPAGLLLAQRGDVDAPIALDLGRALPEERLYRIRLEPLSLGALHELLRTRLGASFPRPTLRRVQEISGGNPFFALEFARALQRRGGTLAPGDDLPVPGNLYELVRDRLERLPEASREAVLAVAALSQPTEELVEAALGPSAEQGLASAVDAGVIELDGGRIRFAHPLLASAVSSQASPQQRAALHGRLAEVVDDAEGHARHLALASSEPDATVAAAVDEAARKARSRGAPGVAADLGELSLRLTPEADREATQERRLTCADYFVAAGDRERAASVIEEGLAEAKPGPVRARLLWQLARIRQAESFDEALPLYEAALQEPDVSPAVLARIHLDISWVLGMGRNIESGLPHARRARELAEQVGDRSSAARALGALGMLELWAGGGRQTAVLEQAVELEEALDREGAPLELDDRPSISLAREFLLAGEYDRARSILESRLRLGRQSDDPAIAGVLFFLATLELRAGNITRAAAHSDEGLEVGSMVGGEAPAGLLCTKAHGEALLGAVDEARTTAEEGRSVAAGSGRPIFEVYGEAILGFIELSLGNAEAAHERLGPAQEKLLALGYEEPHFASLSFLPYEVEALIAIGELDRARGWVSWLDERGRETGRPWVPPVIARCRGLLRAAERDLDGALAAFEEAVSAHKQATQPFELARTLLAYGVTLRRAKERRRARKTLSEALVGFEDLGVPLWAERTRAELSRIAGRAPSPGGLTPTERRVAELVATGRTNREVAAALHISERTVEGNLSRIYAKLGLRSRTELARRFAAEEAAPADS